MRLAAATASEVSCWQRQLCHGRLRLQCLGEGHPHVSGELLQRINVEVIIALGIAAMQVIMMLFCLRRLKA